MVTGKIYRMPDLPSADNDPPRPVEPIEPDFEACCGNGCEPCIFDTYDAERQRYLAALRAWEEARKRRGMPLS